MLQVGDNIMKQRDKGKTGEDNIRRDARWKPMNREERNNKEERGYVRQEQAQRMGGSDKGIILKGDERNTKRGTKGEKEEIREQAQR